MSAAKKIWLAAAAELCGIFREISDINIQGIREDNAWKRDSVIDQLEKMASDLRGDRVPLSPRERELLLAMNALLEAISGEESTDIFCVDARAAIARVMGETHA
jgi:hypothetical protein